MLHFSLIAENPPFYHRIDKRINKQDRATCEMMAQADPQKRCRACASQIDQCAQLCPDCKTYQGRVTGTFQFLSGSTALLVAVASLALWTPRIRVMILPREDVRLISLNSLHGGVVVNLGDPEIFIMQAELTSIYQRRKADRSGVSY